MKNGKRLAAIAAAVVLIASATACSGGKTASQSVSSSAESRIKQLGDQTEMPDAGEEIAVLTTSMGTVKIRLFPAEAPKAVENFVGLVRHGYYDGLIFHRVINNFMVQTGDPTGTGTGGTSIWNKKFEDEFNANLVNIRGAVAMANSGANTNGSQFFIDQAGKDSFQGWSQFEQAYSLYKQSKMTATAFAAQYGDYWLNMDKVTQAYQTLYEQNGGNPHLDGAYSLTGHGHTVFGQVFEGMDVVDQIAAAAVDSNSKPTTDIKIVKAEIVTYEG